MPLEAPLFRPAPCLARGSYASGERYVGVDEAELAGGGGKEVDGVEPNYYFVDNYF